MDPTSPRVPQGACSFPSHSQGAHVMAMVRDILTVKGTDVASVHPGATVYEAAVRMNDKKIGSLVVLDDGRLVGILTERDILQRIVGERRDPNTARVDEVMTTEVVCCQLHTS